MGRWLEALRPVVATCVAVGACASPGMPPGGPPDDAPPAVRAFSPDSNAVNVRARSILIHFDEVISERPTGVRTGGGVGAGPGANALGGLVILSPSDGREAVHWRRTAIEIEPRRGFRPNTTYRVTLLPGVTDLRSNVQLSRTQFVFSTGAEIPTGLISGAVFDWGAGKAAAGARVEVFPGSDSTWRWIGQADSLGRFVIRDLAPGTYAVRGWVDGNNDRRVDRLEISDTATVTLDGRVSVDLYAFVRDTLAPRLSQVEARDSTALRIRFDRPIAAEWDPTGAARLLRADSSSVPVGQLITATEASVRAAGVDSIPADSLPLDSLPLDSLPADSAQADTTAAAAPIFGRRIPNGDWVLLLDSALAPGAYRLVISGAPGLNGRSAPTEREIRIRPPPPPPPAPPADSAKADSIRTDSVAAPRPRPRVR